ncbi:MAG: Kazal-type serine protease inhibitor domain-containing protein [Chitinophagales bacterium]
MKYLIYSLLFCFGLITNFLNLEAQNCIDPSKVNSDQVCPTLYSPVCGCDGRTYNNLCEAQKKGITSTKKGKCPAGTIPTPINKPCVDKSKVNPQQNCPTLYNPVCGCDGRNYNNSCEAEKMGITSVKKGKCPAGTPVIPMECVDEAKINPQQTCPTLYSPVCGCNGKTYNNLCLAQKAGVTSTKKGKCK